MIQNLVYVALVLGILAGVAGVASAVWWKAGFNSLPEPLRSVRRKKRFASSFHTLSISSAAFILLLIKFSTPLETLGGAILVRGLIEVGLRNWKPKTNILTSRHNARKR
jgi:hypothetical protein